MISSHSSVYTSSQKNWNQDLKELLASHINCNVVPMAKRWKQPRCPSVDQWIKKMLYAYSEVLFHPRILSHITTQVNLEDIMLRKYISRRKTNTAWFWSYGVWTPVKLIEAESQMVAARTRGKGRCSWVSIFSHLRASGSTDPLRNVVTVLTNTLVYT